MLQKECAKCGKYTYVEEHHILPKSVFGKNDETVFLCPNCHTDYHQKLGRENLKNPDMVFHLLFYNKCLYGLLSLVIAVLFYYYFI